MERIIPKSSKFGIKLFKSMTLIDLIVAIVLLAIGVLLGLATGMTDAKSWIILAAYVLVCVTLFIGEGEDKTYNQIAYLLRYIVMRRTFVKGNKRGSTDELIPFKKIRSDGIIEYDDYVGAIIEIGCIDLGLMDEREQDIRIAAFADVLNNLSSSSVIQLVKVDRPIKYDEISGILFDKMNKAKVDKDEVKETILKSRLNQVDAVNNVMPLYRPYFYLVMYEEKEDSLFDTIDNSISGLAAAGLEATLLSAREAAVFFKYNYTRNFDEREVEDVDIDDLTDYVKPNKVKFGLSSYTIDDVYAFTLAVREYPLFVGNAWGFNVFRLENTKTVLTIKPVQQAKAIKRIDYVVSENSTHNVSKLSEARSQETQIQTMDELQARLQNENEMLFDCTLTVTGFNNTSSDNNAFRKEVRRALITNGFHCSYLLGRQIDGFNKATIARRPKLKAFERGINTDSLAAVYPFVFSSIVDEEGYYLGSDYYPIILDIWKRNGEFVNSNGVIFGKTGAGKSFFCGLLLSMVYSDNSSIFVLDPEDEYKKLCESVGGIYIDVGSATQGRINPLHIYPVLTDEGELATPEITFNAHLQFLEDFFKLTLKGITQDAFEELNNLIKLMYESVGILPDTDCAEFSSERFPTFDTLLKIAQKESAQNNLTQFRKRNLETVCTYIKKFANGGMYSALWNGASTLNVDSRFVVFNFQSLFGAKNKTVANAQILVVMRFLDMQIINIRERNRNGVEDKILHPFVLLDEGYNFIDEDYPVALNFVYQWYKRIRKYEGAMFFATQNLNDVFGNKEVVARTTAIVNNSQYSFVFGLSSSDLDIMSEIYKNAGGLNEAEISYISSAQRGDCFAICSPRRRARFHVEATDEVRKLFDEKFEVE